MLHALALLASTGVEATVSTAWLQAHLNDAAVHIIYVGDRGAYDRAHIPGARLMDHMDTVGDGHVLASTDVLIRTFTKAGVADGARVVLYGDSPMATGWVYLALASIGHADDVSWLDGSIQLWQSEQRPTSTSAPPAGAGPLTARPAPDIVVDGAWVRAHLDAPDTRILDVRTAQEWTAGHLPSATLVQWQDLFADVRLQRFKSAEEIRALLTRAGIGAGQQVVTYCAVGMRASLMYWAARSAGVPARVYLGSWQDWRRDPTNPIAK